MPNLLATYEKTDEKYAIKSRYCYKPIMLIWMKTAIWKENNFKTAYIIL